MHASQAFLLYQAAMIYSRTSMFPQQRRYSGTSQDVHSDTERRVLSIIALASEAVEAGHLDRRHLVFPLFIAGYATLQPDAKVKALDLISAFESTGIGQNTARTRRLLKVVYEEQRRAYDAGGRMEDVDWLTVARDRGLTVVNCGL